MNNLRHAVADIKKMLNYSKETSIRLSDRNIAWKILLARATFLESILETGIVPDNMWSAVFSMETVPMKPGGLSYRDDDFVIYRATLPDRYKSKLVDLQPKIFSATRQRHIDLVGEDLFYSSLMSDDDIFESVALAYISGDYIFVYPDVRLIGARVIQSIIPPSVDSFGWDTDLGMSSDSLRKAILEILTKDFQINAAAVSDIVSDMKDQLLIMNQIGRGGQSRD